MWRPALLCVLLSVGAARAAVVSESPADCSAVRSHLLEKGVAESALTATGAAGKVCQSAAGSCCSQPWERGIRDLAHDDLRKHLLDSTDQVKNLLQQQVISVQDAILNAIHLVNQSTIQRYNEDRRESDNVIQHSIPTLFGNFMRYFQSQLSDPELESAITVFFDDLFVVTYQDHGEMSATLESCLREKRQELSPFRDLPYRMKEQLLRTFGLAKFYLQSLYGGLEVLNTTTQLEFSESCYEVLSRLSYCPLCQGLTDVRPCTGFCFNAMRGCTAPLSILTESWKLYVEVLRRLASSLQSSNNVESYLFKMYVNISEAMTSVWNRREELDRLVAEVCGDGAPATPAPAESTRRRREVEVQYRSSGDLGGALPPLPQREHLVDFESADEPQLNKLLRAFHSDVDQHETLFQSLLTDACNDGPYDGGPDECWNGETVGDYSKPLAGIGLDSQMFNPEVTVPQTPDPALQEKADLLDQIKQGSNDKLASMPPVDEFQWDNSFYDYDASGDGSGMYPYADDEDDYDYFSGSGDLYPDDPDYTHSQHPHVTLPPSLHEEEEGETTITEETDVASPGINVEPAPPSTTKPPPKTTPKPSGASAAAVCWTLVAAALVAAARL